MGSQLVRSTRNPASQVEKRKLQEGQRPGQGRAGSTCRSPTSALASLTLKSGRPHRAGAAFLLLGERCVLLTARRLREKGLGAYREAGAGFLSLVRQGVTEHLRWAWDQTCQGLGFNGDRKPSPRSAGDSPSSGRAGPSSSNLQTT